MDQPSPSPAVTTPRIQSRRFSRLFSVDVRRTSTTSTAKYCDQNYPQPQWDYSFTSKDFLLKIAQLVVAVICAGLYSAGNSIMTYSITSHMFPNVVFSAFIIITSVIVLSYVLGHIMHDLLIRIFNILATILYFISAAITGHFWFAAGRQIGEEYPEKRVSADLLFAETCMAFVNCILYASDVYMSTKRTLKSFDLEVAQQQSTG